MNTNYPQPSWKSTISHICAGLLAFFFGFVIANNMNKKETALAINNAAKHYFVNNSEKALIGWKIDLPEEFSEIKTGDDEELDLLSAWKNPQTGVINLGFTGLTTKKDNYTFILEHGEIPDPKHNMKDYQIDLYPEYMEIWDHNRFMCKLPYDTTNHVDSVLMVDNGFEYHKNK